MIRRDNPRDLNEARRNAVEFKTESEWSELEQDRIRRYEENISKL